MPASTRGRLLVASPDLGDPNFRRTVVLMVAHDAEGAVGLVLNRPTDITLADALPDWMSSSAPPACLFIGGPVQPEAAIGIGRGVSAAGDLVIGDLGAVDLDGDAAGHDSVRVFIGYSGWGPGQLDGEIARGDWLVVDALTSDVVATTPETLWRDVLRRQRSAASLFAHAPEDASLN
ncbi:MAG: YqgE/AlgH family protein [Acidimicrobiia bacterium]